MSASLPEPRAAVGRILVPLAVMVGAMALLPIGDIRRNHAVRPGFGQVGPSEAVLFLLAAQVLLVAAVVVWLVGGRRRVAVIGVIAAVAWFGPEAFVLDGTSGAVRVLGRFVAGPFTAVLLLHLGVAVLDLDRRRWARRALVVAYAITGLLALTMVVTYHPFGDASCGSCTWQNPLLVWWQPGIIRVLQVVGAGWTAVLAGLAAVAALQWLVSTAPATIGRSLVVFGTAGLAVALVLRSVAFVTVRSEDPASRPWWTAAIALTTSVIILGAGVIVIGAERWLGTMRLRRLAATLAAAPVPGTLQSALRAALHDPGLRIGYRVGPSDLVDASGLPVEPSGGEERWTRVVRDGETVAELSGREADPSEVASALTPTFVVALDNERLRAARLAQLEELRASRARIVAVGDAERRRLERDLHDGVQQQLLSVLFDIRLARLHAVRAGEADRAARFAAAESEAQAAVDALRRIAHGVHPAVLSRSGLGPALTSMAEEAPLAIAVDADGLGRLSETVETAAYQAVADAVARAAKAGATAMAVTVRKRRRQLQVDVANDGSAGPEVPVEIADRVGAAGGIASVEALPGGGTLLRVELPCG
jgi:signal transduction histidine kinase